MPVLGTNPSGNGASGEWDHLGKAYDPALAAEFNYTRNRGSDTAHERQAINSSQDMMKSLMTQNVMDQVMKDKWMAAGIQNAVDAAWHTVAEEDEDAKSEDLEEQDNEDDSELANWRARRIKQMKEKAKKKEALKAMGHGEYEEIVEEDFLKKVTASEYVVCHFYHRNFERCKIMDMHLKRLALRCFGTKFITLNAEKAPFFVEKLRVKTLPTVIFFQDGVAKHHMRGFEEVGMDDEFKTAKLARLLYMHEVVEEHFDSDEEFD